ncbi:MAG: SWF/SNF helicase family protein [Verrucomicrobiae bacterium]|nr:SWF/SNF helicase family protein [Verrucomicrobiae bacterium]
MNGFQKSKGPAIIAVSLKAGGTGINLQSADYVFLLDPWWNPAAESQAIDRVHRMGQSKPVFVYRLITERTIEERIVRMQAEKQLVFDATVGHLADVSVLGRHFESLRELIALRAG